MKSYKIITEKLEKPELESKGVQVFLAPKHLQENDILISVYREHCLCWMFTPHSTIKELIRLKGAAHVTLRLIELFKDHTKDKTKELIAKSSKVEVDRMILIIEKYIIDTIYDYSLSLNMVN